MKLKSINTKKPKSKKKKRKNFIVKSNSSSLFSDLSENYQGDGDSLIGLMDLLPAPLKDLMRNSRVITSVVRQGYAMHVLANGFTFKIKDVKIGNKHKLCILAKEKRNYIFETYV